jgi:hypothetical protein
LPSSVITCAQSIHLSEVDPEDYLGGVCVECLIGKQKKPILFKVTEPSSIPYRTFLVFEIGLAL